MLDAAETHYFLLQDVKFEKKNKWIFLFLPFFLDQEEKNNSTLLYKSILWQAIYRNQFQVQLIFKIYSEKKLQCTGFVLRQNIFELQLFY